MQLVKTNFFVEQKFNAVFLRVFCGDERSESVQNQPGREGYTDVFMT